MSNVSQESTAASTKGAGTSTIMREGVIYDNLYHCKNKKVKLHGTNFLIWSRSAILSILSRGLCCYLIGNSNKLE